MIRNELEYRTTKAALEKLQNTLSRIDKATKNLEPWAKDTYSASIEGQVIELQNELHEYETLRAGRIRRPKLDVIERIPEMLVHSRIALGWSQQDLAKRLGVKAQQVQADESCNYSTASLERLRKVAATLRTGRRKTRTTKTHQPVTKKTGTG